MGTVCEVCGDIGFEHLMVCCSDCKGSSTHRYCLDKVLFDAALADCWFCYDCQQRHGEDPCSRSIDKVSSEKKPGYAHFCALANQRITKRSVSAKDDAAAVRNGKRNPYRKKK
ncbi:hypothetical protein PVAP13_3KG038027 [Panicum virgatum]|uniref:PHD-type domain-containing protein n=1 Tax=Panicum virgatum TaxID=38727 RepID=A0A8T0ULW3_PANVG|nr:hypothetical protein PVAP13_3KG038027 [Panicum virgatum]